LLLIDAGELLGAAHGGG
jgi:hypothetical protein